MEFELAKAGKEELDIISEMSRLFRYDLSEYKGMSCEEDGMFAPIADLNIFFNDSNHAFIIRCEEELAGFALIERDATKESSFIFSYLFILRKFRRTGLGRNATIEVLNKLKGHWKIDYNAPNTTAMEFWQDVINSYTNGNYTLEDEGHKKWGPLKVIRFTNEPA